MRAGLSGLVGSEMCIRDSCKNVLSLMSLGARQGESLELEVEGPDEVQAAGFLKGLLRTIL